MPEDEDRIRALIERWAAGGALPATWMAVLADHADDIVMFDVPPPDDGVRGHRRLPRDLAAVLRVAGAAAPLRDRVAGRHRRRRRRLRARPVAVRHTEELAADPDNRLRLTVGLRKQDGRWVVAHEHHSFPLTGRD